jgi:hypothetical protein
MTHSIQEINAKVACQTLTSKQEPALLSEQALAVDWDRPEEDEAWASVMPFDWSDLATSNRDTSTQSKSC